MFFLSASILNQIRLDCLVIIIIIFVRHFCWFHYQVGIGIKRDMKKKEQRKEYQGKGDLPGFKYVWKAIMKKKKMIVRYAYRQNSIFHNKSQGHKQRTQVLERKESQANHIPIIICRRNSKIVSKEITDKSTTGSQKGQRAKQPSFLQFFSH